MQPDWLNNSKKMNIQTSNNGQTQFPYIGAPYVTHQNQQPNNLSFIYPNPMMVPQMPNQMIPMMMNGQSMVPMQMPHPYLPYIPNNMMFGNHPYGSQGKNFFFFFF